ncbi:MAG TPA: ATP-dependent DNA helicase RecG [Nocardioides sp.]|nr:ATP-dependent DNA helicase RecG [Nocardioides sp.]
MPSVSWDSKLSAVAGSAATKIEKAFGYRTVGELLRHYPRRYVEKGSVSDLGTLTLDEHITFVARVVSVTQKSYPDRRRGGLAYRLEVVVATERDRIRLTFFDKKKHLADWRARTIREGSSALFSGKVGRFRDEWQLTNPQTTLLGSEDDAEEAIAEFAAQPDLTAIYPATATLQSWQLQETVLLALRMLEDVPEPLPEDVRRSRGLVDARQALEWIHRPDSWAEQRAAEERLRFEEAFVTQTALAQRRAGLEALAAQPRNGRDGGLLERFDARLPFTLTEGQYHVSEEILHDLAAGHPMHRLLQGEVGSGKTVVALRAMLRVVDSGGQAALLAPTEVLAQQHHRSIGSMLGDLAAGGMLGGDPEGTRVALLTGSQNAATRRQALLDVASGAAGIVVGTHALLEEKVQFADLGLVVVDEQHRFGVEQRAALASKAGVAPPHVLVMTATPIPRTVAMTVFGDLETSTLVELPHGRAPIQTTVVPLREQPAWLDRVWGRVREEVAAGRQCYVVCPRVDASTDDPEGSEDLPAEAHDGEGGSPRPVPLAAVEQVAPLLAEGALAGLRVGMMHGRMPSEDKDRVMREFAAGALDVLVATTVIEVGVDVGNATAMVVLDADRFGVSQLHQMRGRVGRGGHPGLCLLVTNAETGSAARQRLDAVAATTDGFELSRLDLEQRREGDVLGASQSGGRSSLRLLSVIRHEDVIADARAAAAQIVAADPVLARHPDLLRAVDLLQETEQADYLQKA